jgi:hypothetical protein
MFSYDPTRGEWTNTRLNLRTALFNEAMWQHVIKDLHSTFGSAADSFLYQFGINMGKFYGEEIAKDLKNSEAFRDTFLLAQAAGWGIFEIPYITEELLNSKSEIKIISKNNYFISASKSAGDESFALFKGSIVGIINEIRGFEHVCILDKVYFDVGWCCEIIVKPITVDG